MQPTENLADHIHHDPKTDCSRRTVNGDLGDDTHDDHHDGHLSSPGGWMNPCDVVFRPGD